MTGFCQYAKPYLAFINSILEMVKVAAGKQYYLKQFSGMHQSQNSPMMSDSSYHTVSICSIGSGKIMLHSG